MAYSVDIYGRSRLKSDFEREFNKTFGSIHGTKARRYLKSTT